jgi:hypothetical protein
MAADNQGDERADETRVGNKVIDPDAPAGTEPASTGAAGGGQSPLDAQRRAEESHDAFDEKPHLFVAGAFVGGLVFAQLLKRLGGGDDD